jgi:hypothetical protein
MDSLSTRALVQQGGLHAKLSTQRDPVTGKSRVSIDSTGLTAGDGAGVPTEGIVWTAAEKRAIRGGPSAPIVDVAEEDDNDA